MDHKVLVGAIATAIMSYDQSSDTDVDPDWAVKSMEDLVHTLNQLSDDDRAQFRADLEALAADLPADPFDDRWRNSYRDLPGLMRWDEPTQD